MKNICPEIQKFVQQLVSKFNLEKIILFGSFAYGKPSKSSDVDLLVIIKTNLRPIEQGILSINSCKNI